MVGGSPGVEGVQRRVGGPLLGPKAKESQPQQRDEAEGKHVPEQHPLMGTAHTGKTFAVFGALTLIPPSFHLISMPHCPSSHSFA